MKNLKKYYTGLMVPDWEEYPRPPYKGRGWHIVYSEPTESGSSEDKYVDQKEITIVSSSFKHAQKVLGLLICSMWLTVGETLFAEVEMVTPADSAEAEQISRENIFFDAQTSHYLSTGDIPYACIVTAKSSHRRPYMYALTKFRLASFLHSELAIDMDPKYATEHLGVSPFISDHVRFSYSIILSYSVIEEIGLEIRATKSSPSIINGKWNPTVKQDLESRLREAKINLDDRVPWALRGRPTKIEMAKPLPSKGKCSWARGPYLRDCELEVIDAIRIASFLRSKISSHKFDPIVSSLSSYDVENIRHLARRLLLEKLGYWRYSGLEE